MSSYSTVLQWLQYSCLPGSHSAQLARWKMPGLRYQCLSVASGTTVAWLLNLAADFARPGSACSGGGPRITRIIMYDNMY